MYENGYQINRVAISGSNGPRASLFAPAAKEVFGFNPVLAAAASEPLVTAQLVPGSTAPGASPWPYVIVGGGVVAALAIAGII